MTPRAGDITPGAKGLGFKAQQVWVALVEMGPDDEGVPASGLVNARTGAMIMTTLMTADPARLSWLSEQAERIARDSGKRVRVVCFNRRVELETIEP